MEGETDGDDRQTQTLRHVSFESFPTRKKNKHIKWRMNENKNGCNKLYANKVEYYKLATTNNDESISWYLTRFQVGQRHKKYNSN